MTARVLAVAALTAVGTTLTGSGVAGASSTYQVANTGGASLRIRSGPSLNDAVLGQLNAGQSFTIACQTTGDMVNNTTDIWDQVAGTSGYVSDYYVSTPVVGAFTSGIPQCSTSAPAPPPGPVPSPSPPTPPPTSPSSPTSQEQLASGLDGVNWADARDNFQSGWVIPTGLTASDSYSTVYGIAEKTLEGFNAQGATTVRLPINTASVVNSSWWPNYQATVDAATALGMNVILSYWDSNNSGTVDPDWKAMWETVIQHYGSYSNVYFEIMNEPDGYNSNQWEAVADAWVTTFTAAPYDVPADHVIVSAAQDSAQNCVGWMQNDLSAVANDPTLAGTLLSVHFYNWCNGSDDSPMFDQLVAPYISHGVVIDEFGTTVGSDNSWVDFGAPNSPDPNVQYLQHLATALHNSGVGAVYWPGLRGGDSYSVWNLDSNGNLVPNGNNSILPWLRYAWT